MKERIITEGVKGCDGYREAVARVPEASDVAAVKVGGEAPDCFGKMALVTRVSARDTVRANGKPFAHYVTRVGPEDNERNGCGCSNSMVAGVLMRSVFLTGILNSSECDDLEEEMRRAVSWHTAPIATTKLRWAW